MYTTMTYQEFLDTYKPIQNKLTKYPSEEQLAFETYGEEQEFVLAQPQENVWTEVDGDGGTYIINGFHYVNRIQYFVCEVPSALPKYQEVVVSLYKECEDCNCYGGYGTIDNGKECKTCSTDYSEFVVYPETREELIELFGEEYANEQV